jgi:hypothetical protein
MATSPLRPVSPQAMSPVTAGDNQPGSGRPVGTQRPQTPPSSHLPVRTAPTAALFNQLFARPESASGNTHRVRATRTSRSPGGGALPGSNEVGDDSRSDSVARPDSRSSSELQSVSPPNALVSTRNYGDDTVHNPAGVMYTDYAKQAALLLINRDVRDDGTPDPEDGTLDTARIDQIIHDDRNEPRSEGIQKADRHVNGYPASTTIRCARPEYAGHVRSS